MVVRVAQPRLARRLLEQSPVVRVEMVQHPILALVRVVQVVEQVGLVVLPQQAARVPMQWGELVLELADKVIHLMVVQGVLQVETPVRPEALVRNSVVVPVPVAVVLVELVVTLILPVSPLEMVVYMVPVAVVAVVLEMSPLPLAMAVMVVRANKASSSSPTRRL